MMKANTVKDLYGIFCEELEGAIKSTFAPEKYPRDTSKASSKELEIIRAACFAFANLVLTKQMINEAAKDN